MPVPKPSDVPEGDKVLFLTIRDDHAVILARAKVDGEYATLACHMVKPHSAVGPSFEGPDGTRIVPIGVVSGLTEADFARVTDLEGAPLQKLKLDEDGPGPADRDPAADGAGRGGVEK